METAEKILYMIGQALLFVLEQIWAGLKIFGAWLYKCLADWIRSITLPTTMKLFGDINANRTLFIALAVYILFMNIWAFRLFAKDKSSAKRKTRRVSEAKLMRVCFFGGATGGLIGMNVFHHKTLKKKFTVGITLMFIVQLVLYSFVLGFLGFWAFL